MFCLTFLSHFADSNRGPTHYECVALPTELKWRLRLAVGVRRLELPASTSRTWRASQLRYTPRYCVLAGIRTLDPLIKSQLLYQLSYQDIIFYFACAFRQPHWPLLKAFLNMDVDVV